MNIREAMEALLIGKQLEYRGYIISMTGDGVLVDQYGDEQSLRSGVEYKPHEEPNRHPKGSYLWAYEEAKRGRPVTRFKQDCYFQRETFLNYDEFTHEDFTANDWEHVK